MPHLATQFIVGFLIGNSAFKNLQENLENEAENYGKSGWELCTALVTSHVRMKADGSEFRKFVVFFQRPKKEFVPATEKGKSQEDLTEVIYMQWHTYRSVAAVRNIGLRGPKIANNGNSYKELNLNLTHYGLELTHTGSLGY